MQNYILMAQHIGILRVELGANDYKTIEDSELNFASLLKVVESFNGFEARFPILSGIDEYGDTYFNAPQRLRLSKELQDTVVESPSLHSAVRPVIKFIEKAQSNEHIQFVGD